MIDVGDSVSDGHVTFIVAVLAQPLVSVPVTVYTVGVVGSGTVLTPTVVLSPALGAQLYVAAPEAVAVVPRHTVDGAIATVGKGFTVIGKANVPSQPLTESVTVTV